MLKRFWEIVKRHPYLIGGSILFLVVLIWVSGRSKPAAQAPVYQAPDNSAAIQANAQLTGLQAQLSAAAAHDQASIIMNADNNQAQIALTDLLGKYQTNNNTIAANVQLQSINAQSALGSLVASLNATSTDLITRTQGNVAIDTNKTKVDLANVDLTKAQTTQGGLASTIAALYTQILGRAPDTTGLLYWQEQAAKGTSVSKIIEAFNTSAEKSNYSAASTAAAGGATGGVNTVAAALTNDYQQYFGRAPDAAGLAFYQDQVTSGKLSLADVSNLFATTAADGLSH